MVTAIRIRAKGHADHVGQCSMLGFGSSHRRRPCLCIDSDGALWKRAHGATAAFRASTSAAVTSAVISA